MKARPLPPFRQVARMIHYCPETGEFRWMRDHRGRPRGSISGGLRNNRWFVRINNHAFIGARVAYLLMTGQDPGELQIDHINGDTLDNRWANLRAVTLSQNLMNRRPYGHATSKYPPTGFKGVYQRGQRFIAVPSIKRKLSYLGTFDTPEEAAVRVAEFYADHGLLHFQPASMRNLLMSDSATPAAEVAL